MKKLYPLIVLLSFCMTLQGQDITNELIPQEGSLYSQGFNSYRYSTSYHPLFFKDGGILNLSQSESRGYDSLSYVRLGDTISVRHHRPFSSFSSSVENFLVEGDTAVKAMSTLGYDWDGLVDLEYEYKPNPILFSFPMSPGDEIFTECDEFYFFQAGGTNPTPISHSVSYTVKRTFVGYMDIISDFGFYSDLIFVREDWIKDGSQIGETHFCWLYENSGIFFPIFEMYEYGELDIGQYLYITEAIPSSGTLGGQIPLRPEENLAVYPNPAEGQFIQILLTEDEENLSIYSSSGILMKDFPSSRAGIMYLDISDLASGMYILQSGTNSSKLVVH